MLTISPRHRPLCGLPLPVCLSSEPQAYPNTLLGLGTGRGCSRWTAIQQEGQFRRTSLLFFLSAEETVVHLMAVLKLSKTQMAKSIVSRSLLKALRRDHHNADIFVSEMTLI